MKIWAIMVWAVAAAIFLTSAPVWAIYKLNTTTDPRWMMTIIGAPIMGAVLIWVGREFWKLSQHP